MPTFSPTGKSIARLLIGLALLAGCREEPAAPAVPADPAPEAPAPRLLALGDSYTVGQGVPAEDRWPRQLADALAAGGDTLDSVLLVAESGWTTGDLREALDMRPPAGGDARAFDLVTLLIGANNLFREWPLAVTAADWAILLDRAVALAGDRPDRVLVLTLPDYGATPMGGLGDPDAVRTGIDRHNARLREICRNRGLAVIDITPLSRQAAGDPSLVARDGLHYTAEMYRRWTDLILPAARDRLRPEAEGDTR